MPTFGPQGLPYPNASDAPDIPGAFLSLEQKIQVGGAIPFASYSALTASTAFQGQIATVYGDTTQLNGLYLSLDGSTWTRISSSYIVPVTANTFTAGVGVNAPRVLVQGRQATLYGQVAWATGANYSSILTIPSSALPPTMTTQRHIGYFGVGNGSSLLMGFLALNTNGTVGNQGPVTGSLPGSGSTIDFVGATWALD